MPKKLLVVILFIVFTGAAFFYFKLNAPQSFAFRGTIRSIEGNTILAEGFFVVGNNGTQSPSERVQTKIIIHDETALTRIVPRLPFTREEINAQLKKNGMIPGGKLDREEDRSDIATLKTDFAQSENIDISAESEENIYNASEFHAARIDYYLPLTWRAN